MQLEIIQEYILIDFEMLKDQIHNKDIPNKKLCFK